MKPIIGITCSVGQNIYSMNMTNTPQMQSRMNDTYIRAIVQAGGIPVILPSYEDLSVIPELVNRLDGVLLSGGTDLDPAIFGQRATKNLGTVVPQRDAFELELTRYVVEKTQKPLLGICRGIQVLNVALGGTLHIDLPDDGKLCHSMDMYPRYVPTHDVQVAENSRLASIMGEGVSRVNSFHHQAAKDVAETLTVSAVSLLDGVVEALELSGNRFVLGVQWHPEELVHMEAEANLFRKFVEAARG